MLRHVFLADVRPGIAAQDVDQLLAAWRAFPAAIAEIRSLTAGRNLNRDDRRYAVVLVADFEDGGAWQIFMQHPAHVAVREGISAKVLAPETRVMVQYVIETRTN